MRNEPTRCMARLEKRELAEIPGNWSKEEQGEYLWRLLWDKGVDPGRLYAVEYFPYRHCWLLSQECGPGLQTGGVATAPRGEAAQLFYSQLSADLRRTALTAFAAAAGRSVHFARFGCKYQLPAKPQETTPADLVRLLGGRTDDDGRVRFTSEGGWQIEPREN